MKQKNISNSDEIKNKIDKETRDAIQIDISKINGDIKRKGSFKYKQSIVSFIDILGFSYKKEIEDIEGSLFDFASPLAIISKTAKNVKFYIFSDCAFIVSPIKFADELLSSIRYAFSHWISDGILVRGGIAKGTFGEILTWAHPNKRHDFGSNYVSSLFSGTAVVEAVRLEESGDAALLFATENCARYYNAKYDEQIFLLSKNKPFISWTFDDKYLINLAAITSLRLIRFLQSSDDYTKIIKKLKNTLLYSIFGAKKPILPLSVILAYLSTSNITEEIRNEMYNILKFKPNIKDYRDLIETWKNTESFEFLKAIANSDSSLPNI